MSMANWMRKLPDTKWLRQIVMPGSHDAGVYGTAHTILRSKSLVKESYVVCQHSDFKLQAAAGSRFFDCRVFLRKVPSPPGIGGPPVMENRLGHFAREKVSRSRQPKMGGYGGALGAILGDALDFVIANPTEFVILRFSHTYHPTECVAEITNFVQGTQAYWNAVYKQPGNLAITPIGQLRGKVIMVFDDQFNHHITPGQGIHRFKKYKDGLTQIDGLSTCGTFSSSMKMSKVHDGAISGADSHVKHPTSPSVGHLHFVYWQQTAGITGEKDIFKTTSKPKKGGAAWTGGAHANLGDLVAELGQKKNATGRLPANVISHDFVTKDTCRSIIRLNPECV